MALFIKLMPTMKQQKSGRNAYLAWEDGVMHKLLRILPAGFVAKYDNSAEIRVVTLSYLRYFLLYIVLLSTSFYPIGRYIELLANTSGMLIGTISTIIGFLLFVITKNPSVGTNLVMVNSMTILCWLSYSYGGMANNILRHDALIFAMGMFFGLKGVISGVAFNIISTTTFMYLERNGMDFYEGRSREEIREIMWYHAMYQTIISTFLMYSYERKQAQALRHISEMIRRKNAVLFLKSGYFWPTGAYWQRMISHPSMNNSEFKKLLMLAYLEFLCRMSHELRTPLVGIVGAIDILNNAKNITAEQLKLIQIARSCATNLLGIINDVLDFSKIEAEKMKLHFENVNLRDLIDTCAQVVSPLISTNPKVQLKIDFDAQRLPQKFLGDSLRIRQVLINLLSNAIKFTEQGTITVKVSLEQNINNIPWLLQKSPTPILKKSDSLDNFDRSHRASHRRSGSFDNMMRSDSPKLLSMTERSPLFLVFSVIDTGIGIDPGIITKLFDAFEQADTSTSKKYGGSGLGLAICKNICKLHGGDIAAESGGKNKGATFYFYVPFIEVAEDNLNKSMNEITNPIKYPVTVINIAQSNVTVDDVDDVEHADPRDSKLEEKSEDTVLLVEDNKVNQLVIKTMLSKLKYKVDIANNGAEAVDFMQRKTYSIVFMDIEMPILNGLEATRQLRERGFSTPIVALTAHALVETREQAFKDGVNDVIAKPCNFEQLRQVCSTFITPKNKEDKPR